ncbi:MAG: two-component system, OmpR family, response regulator MprA [Solirubrobacteraceae bacterium]|jgi:two-component system response regulator MprA|nr:two-component system, OmpR family, response regulator MprA [Solirubrobacteraceae bacterium]
MVNDGTDTPARILVVEDDRSLRDMLHFALATGGWQVALAENAQHGLSQLVATTPDVVVLDVGLPDMDGLVLCRRLRRAGNQVPVLMVSARGGVEHRIDGLDAGADDYLPKPFDVGELRARLRALLRRTGDAPVDRVAFGELCLDRERHGVWVESAFVHLSRTELQLLELLMLNAGTVLHHNVIYDRVWGYDFGPGANSLRVYVGYLRRKLEAAGARPLIRTVRGVGYVLREP